MDILIMLHVSMRTHFQIILFIKGIVHEISYNHIIPINITYVSKRHLSNWMIWMRFEQIIPVMHPLLWEVFWAPVAKTSGSNEYNSFTCIKLIRRPKKWPACLFCLSNLGVPPSLLRVFWAPEVKRSPSMNLNLYFTLY